MPHIASLLREACKLRNPLVAEGRSWSCKYSILDIRECVLLYEVKSIACDLVFDSRRFGVDTSSLERRGKHRFVAGL